MCLAFYLHRHPRHQGTRARVREVVRWRRGRVHSSLASGSLSESLRLWCPLSWLTTMLNLALEPRRPPWRCQARHLERGRGRGRVVGLGHLANSRNFGVGARVGFGGGHHLSGSRARPRTKSRTNWMIRLMRTAKTGVTTRRSTIADIVSVADASFATAILLSPTGPSTSPQPSNALPSECASTHLHIHFVFRFGEGSFTKDRRLCGRGAGRTSSSTSSGLCEARRRKKLRMLFSFNLDWGIRLRPSGTNHCASLRQSLNHG
mmetsp:Transcript_19931/g.54664  ORF Transcript_19931/g.54664 Transcript_19931/m.54664 type:complete len:262 (+) Transcript_19931:2539-3324(+)